MILVMSCFVALKRRNWFVPRVCSGPGPVQCEALKSPCLIHLWSWMNPSFPLLAFLGNKNWPPSMKLKKMKIFWNKMPMPMHHSIPERKLRSYGSIAFCPITRDAVGGNLIEVENLVEQNGLSGLQVVHFECPRYWKPLISFNFEVGWMSLSHY